MHDSVCSCSCLVRRWREHQQHSLAAHQAMEDAGDLNAQASEGHALEEFFRDWDRECWPELFFWD